MAIQALSQTAVRVLGASQVLTDPASVVKELIDNALDAAAMSVAIEIHHNTLDLIQVRDNGRGIPPEDRALVAKRYCTSKISHADELKDIGGSSLGFRGEALASAAELSGTLTISTRVEGEQVAAALKINQKGEVVGQDRASLSVGTTVKITDFIKANPVRRQVALNNTEACLKKIKRLLCSYALARPHIRFSMRVLKAKNTKGDWIYAPKADCSVEDAAFKVVGASCASQCTGSVLEMNDFTFQAFLPRADAEAGKISNVGSFLSIDRRPVSSARGTPKQIVKVFRDVLKNVATSFEDIKDPFLCLEITCPKGSYDVNLEPAKDDVLFEELPAVIDGLRKLLAALYGTPAERHEQFGWVGTNDGQADSQASKRLGNITASSELSDEPAPSWDQICQLPREIGTTPPLDEDLELELPQAFRPNMYDFDEDNLDKLDTRPPSSRADDHFRELRQAQKDINLSNPFVLAKVHGALRPAPAEQSSHDPTSLTNLPSSATVKATSQLEARTAALPTPRPSSPSPPQESQISKHVDSAPMRMPASQVQSQPIQRPRFRTPVDTDSGAIHDHVITPATRHKASPTYDATLRVQAVDALPGTPICAIPDIIRPYKKRQLGVNRPFIPPSKSHPRHENVWFDFKHMERRHDRPHRNQPMNDLVRQGELSVLEQEPCSFTPTRQNRDIREFVGRSTPELAASMIGRGNDHPPYPAITAEAQENRPVADGNPRPRRGVDGDFVSATEVAAMQTYCTSPEKGIAQAFERHKTSGRRALRQLSTNVPAFEDDPPLPVIRARTPSRRRSSAKFGCTKSSKLALERIPDGHSVAKLMLHHSSSPAKICRLTSQIDAGSSFLKYNQPAVGLRSFLMSNDLDPHELTNSLHDLLIQRGGDDNGTTMPQLLFEEMRAAFAKHSQTSGDADQETSS